MDTEEKMPKISAVMPLYNGFRYIEESVLSIQAQTFSDWEFLIINEYGSDDGCAEVVKKYARKDSRIRLVQNDEKLGLAESLNKGIALAEGEYIARVDVDDPSHPQRFEKQVKYLDANKDTVLCGTWQRSVLPGRSYIQEAPSDPEELKAALLFGCEISHCSVMFRRKVFIYNQLKYDPHRLGEDYDLWTRIMFDYKLVNLPEALADHRWGFGNISIEKGNALKQEVCETSAQCLKKFHINVSPKDYILLSGWRNKPEKFARDHRSYFLQKQKKLLVKLYENNGEEKLIQREALKKVIFRRWNWVCECAGIFFQKVPYSAYKQEMINAKVSIVLPVYHGVNTLRETIDSILVQEMEEWELIIVLESGNDDGSDELAEMYSFFDSRIYAVKNEKKLGLAASLNKGIQMASTDYIARIDADDLANAKRLRAQYQYLKKHPKTGICQTYQHYFGERAGDFIHRPPLKAEDMKAKLLFFCDACHSTVMFRKSIFEKYNLAYSTRSVLEDYELWTRAVGVTDFVTLPEVYGEYRVSGQNISVKNADAIGTDMCKIVARCLKENLGIEVEEQYLSVLNGWNNIFLEASPDRHEELLAYLQQLLYQVWTQNLSLKYYQKKALLGAIACKWCWAKYNESWQGEKEAVSIEEVLELPLPAYRNIRQKTDKLIKRVCMFPQKVFWHVIQRAVQNQVTKALLMQKKEMQELKEQLAFQIREEHKRLEEGIKDIKSQNEEIRNWIGELCYQQKLIPYYPDEKIRMIFLFQIASFWPSWDSFFRACKRDKRIDARLVFLDETATEDVQMQSARNFLEQSGLEYTEYNSFDIHKFCPHIMVMQTPYDEWHRQPSHWSGNFKAEGIRIVYIPYGIEISDTEDSHNLHFHTSVINNSWRVYTFSERMRNDYLKYAWNRSAVRAVGLPKFDYFFDKESFPLNSNIKKKCKGRKIVLWKLHFPKQINVHGVNTPVTPDINEYIAFAEHICEYRDLFFIIMPHPKFKTEKNSFSMKEKIRNLFGIAGMQENVFIDERDDYRESLLWADFIITDRSSIMVEAGGVGAPVLYLSSAQYNEPVTEAIKPLIDSYYQGHGCADMLNFIRMCREGDDFKKKARIEAFKTCIPYFDGKCGERVKEDIVHDLEGNIL